MPSLVERLKQNRGIEMTPELMRVLMARIRELPDQEKRELEAEFSEYERALAKERRQRNFLEYVKYVWPAFIAGRHHAIMANAFERIAAGTLKRVAISLPPRHSKSELTSWLLPSWYIGKFPDRQIIQCGHTAELAIGFGGKVRNTVQSAVYKETFPGVFLAADTKAKGRWKTNRGGIYHALGVGGAVAGKGADLCVHPNSIVVSKRGRIRARDVVFGDQLLGAGGFGRVSALIRSHSDTEIVINGKARVTPSHPMFTFNRGWVPAGELVPGDKLSENSVSVPIRTLESVPTTSDGLYVNFTVDGHNTYVVDDFLSHNCIIDDPVSEQQAITATSGDVSVYDSVYEWFKSGPVQRLQPDGAICIVMTRWSKRDLVGRVLEAAARMDMPDDWEIIEFPAILPNGDALWPEYWPIDKLLQKKAEINDVHLWNATYQQNPTSEEGAIIKREWWRTWPDKTNPPRCEFVIQSWDTAYTEKTRNDFCACTTWGVFKPDLDYLRQHGVEMAPLLPDARHIIVLDSFQERMEFPDLKVRAKQEYQRMKPDCLLVEGKAAGMPLIQELLAMGIPASRYDPNRKEGDKFVRLNSVAELFKSGMVWAPDMGWARELRDTLAEFPNGEHDDLVDSASQALLRFRQGGLVALATDETAKKRDPRRVREYY